MSRELISKIEKKENKNEAEWLLLQQSKCLNIIGSILVSESKLDISSEEAVQRIRECMKDNL